jgi:hypothetical protein
MFLELIAWRGAIDLEGQNIGDEGCRILSDLVEIAMENETTCPITSINLKRNNIGDEGARYLAKLMRYPINIYLGDNHLTNVGDDILMDVIQNRRKQNEPRADYFLGRNPGVLPEWKLGAKEDPRPVRLFKSGWRSRPCTG